MNNFTRKALGRNIYSDVEVVNKNKKYILTSTFNINWLEILSSTIAANAINERKIGGER
jgi:hypothetical protein